MRSRTVNTTLATQGSLLTGAVWGLGRQSRNTCSLKGTTTPRAKGTDRKTTAQKCVLSPSPTPPTRSLSQQTLDTCRAMTLASSESQPRGGAAGKRVQPPKTAFWEVVTYVLAGGPSRLSKLVSRHTHKHVLFFLSSINYTLQFGVWRLVQFYLRQELTM